MKHASDEELLLLAYGEQTRAAGHAAACARCRLRVTRMREFLASLEETPVPERDEAYGKEVWRRLAPRLAEEAVPFRRRLFSADNLLRAAAVLALIAAAFLVGRTWPRPAQPPSGPARERIFLAAVGDHLDRSQVVLLDLVNADPGAEIPQRSRERARDLLADNRLYRQAASLAGDAGVASVLDDLERVLLEVEHGAGTAQARAALLHRIDSEEVLFKLRVLDARVRARQEAPRAAGRLL